MVNRVKGMIKGKVDAAPLFYTYSNSLKYVPSSPLVPHKSTHKFSGGPGDNNFAPGCSGAEFQIDNQPPSLYPNLSVLATLRFRQAKFLKY